MDTYFTRPSRDSPSLRDPIHTPVQTVSLPILRNNSSNSVHQSLLFHIELCIVSVTRTRTTIPCSLERRPKRSWPLIPSISCLTQHLPSRASASFAWPWKTSSSFSRAKWCHRCILHLKADNLIPAALLDSPGFVPKRDQERSHLSSLE